MITVTESELVEALREAAQPGSSDVEGALTVAEMAACTNRGEKYVRDNIRKLLAEGKAELVRIPRTAIDGRLQNLPAYRLVRPDRAA